MDTANLIAIDTHTHLEVSCRNPFDNYGEEYDRAADKYFRNSKRPTMDETIAYYREKKIGFVNFTVDAESQMGRARITNEEIADAAAANSDIMIAFGSIDPHKGKMGGREARREMRAVEAPTVIPRPTIRTQVAVVVVTAVLAAWGGGLGVRNCS